jgi:hypothetical protein
VASFPQEHSQIDVWSHSSRLPANRSPLEYTLCILNLSPSQKRVGAWEQSPGPPPSYLHSLPSTQRWPSPWPLPTGSSGGPGIW